MVHHDHAAGLALAVVAPELVAILYPPGPDDLGEEPDHAHDKAQDHAGGQRVVAHGVVTVVVVGAAMESAHLALGRGHGLLGGSIGLFIRSGLLGGSHIRRIRHGQPPWHGLPR